MMRIDAVITWVDGNDERHRQKRYRYCPQEVLKDSDKAGDERYANIGEIYWCVASINRFAPWINRIFIVTDEQDPGLEDFLNVNFPEGYIPFEIIDHKQIFNGYEDCLPTFNSISIETMTWRIPGLSTHYLEFNDDLMLTSPVSPDDFFTKDGKVICYGKRAILPFTRLTRLLKPKGTVTTKCSHANAASVAGCRLWYLRLDHCQKALRRDFWEEYYRSNPEVLSENIRYRFRSVRQFTTQALQYIMLYRRGECVVKPVGKKMFFFQPKGNHAYFIRKMIELEAFKGKFLCLNSIEKTEPEELEQLVRWIEGRLRINRVPHK